MVGAEREREWTAAVERASAEGREAWPDVELPAPAFAAWLAERAADADELAKLRTADLYLACACARGDPRAIAFLRRSCAPELRRVFADPRTAGTDPADLEQMLLTKLLVGEGDSLPRIVEYRGSGQLRTWVRVVAWRIRLNSERRRAHRVDPLPDQVASALVDREDPELAFVQERYRDAMRAAIARVLGELGPRERTLLRLQVVHGLNATAIAAAHGVHRATAKRWLADVRRQVLERTREVLAAQLGIASGELASVIRLVGSRLEASVRRHLLESGR